MLCPCCGTNDFYVGFNGKQEDGDCVNPECKMFKGVKPEAKPEPPKKSGSTPLPQISVLSGCSFINAPSLNSSYISTAKMFTGAMFTKPIEFFITGDIEIPFEMMDVIRFVDSFRFQSNDVVYEVHKHVDKSWGIMYYPSGVTQHVPMNFTNFVEAFKYLRDTMNVDIRNGKAR